MMTETSGARGCIAGLACPQGLRGALGEPPSRPLGVSQAVRDEAVAVFRRAITEPPPEWRVEALHGASHGRIPDGAARCRLDLEGVN